MEKIELIKKLTEELNNASILYYNTGRSTLSDNEWDSKFDQLKLLEEETGFYLEESPTKRVGSMILDSIGKTKLDIPMLSLAKCHSAKEIADFSKGKKIVGSIKCDGLSVRIIYKDGKLVSANTRGNGEEGSDISEHIKYFMNVPMDINKKETYIIDGECIIYQKVFEKINENLPENDKYANSRNLAAGSLSLLDLNIVKERCLNFIAWNVIVGGSTNSLSENLNEADRLGFITVPRTVLNDENLIQSTIDGRMKYAEINGIPCDGIVFAFDDIEYGKSLGRTSHHFNNGIAWKPARNIVNSKLKEVEWSIGKTGNITPVAIFEPVELDGTIVEKASLHNISIMRELGIKNVGQTVYIYKANLIIPQVDHCDDDCTNGINISVPSVCPICGGTTEIVKENNTEVLKCNNTSCKGKLLKKLSHFVSKNAMNIDDLSEATLEKFIDLEWLTCFKDIYYLAEHKEEMYTLCGFGKRSVNKLLKAIDNSRNTTLDRFIYSLSIPLVGRSNAKEISRYCCGSIASFIDLLKYYNNLFRNMNGIGEKMTQSIIDWWNDNEDMFVELIKEINIENPEEEKVEDLLLDGLNFVITGSLNHFANRDELVEKITSLGGKVSGAVSTKTNYLINNDSGSTSGKNKKAIEIGVPIITEDMLLEMITSQN